MALALYLTLVLVLCTCIVIAFIAHATDYAAKANAMRMRKLATKDVATMIALSKRYHHDGDYANAYDAEMTRLRNDNAAIGMEPKTLAHNVIIRMS